MVRATYAPVPFTLLKPGTAFHGPTQALPERVGLEHPAIDVMTVRTFAEIRSLLAC